MHDMPDQSASPKRLHTHVIAEFLVNEAGVDKSDATRMARDLMNDLFEARWEIISKQVMDAVLASGGVDPAVLAKQYEGVQE